jgi:hypothetical protein
LQHRHSPASKRRAASGSMRSLQARVVFGSLDLMYIRHRLSPSTGSQTPRQGCEVSNSDLQAVPPPQRGGT